jgi:hypothetical protein
VLAHDAVRQLWLVRAAHGRLRLPARLWRPLVRGGAAGRVRCHTRAAAAAASGPARHAVLQRARLPGARGARHQELRVRAPVHSARRSGRRRPVLRAARRPGQAAEQRARPGGAQRALPPQRVSARQQAGVRAAHARRLRHRRRGAQPAGGAGDDASLRLQRQLHARGHLPARQGRRAPTAVLVQLRLPRRRVRRARPRSLPQQLRWPRRLHPRLLLLRTGLVRHRLLHRPGRHRRAGRGQRPRGGAGHARGRRGAAVAGEWLGRGPSGGAGRAAERAAAEAAPCGVHLRAAHVAGPRVRGAYVTRSLC